MEIFFSDNIEGDVVRLDPEEAKHCLKVLRHRPGDTVNIIDGRGTMMVCTLLEGGEARIVERHERWGGHPYRLTMAVCPTKNNERYEWFIEKAVEVGVDRIVPVIGERSERKVYKTERARKIALSAAKQSLKGAVPEIAEPLSVREFLREDAAAAGTAEADGGSVAPRKVRLICYCFEGETPRLGIREALAGAASRGALDVTVLIGPEGDFSPAEASAAIAAGYVPVHLGPSRLRTETAALAAAMAVYLGKI